MDREAKIIRTSVEAIIVNILLVVFKMFVGFLSNSIAIILDAVNNLTDALSSVITIIGTKLAGKAPDKEHPFGYGRIEYMTSAIIGAIIFFAGFTALQESWEKIVNPTAANYTTVTIIIVAVGVIVKFGFGRYVKRIGENVNSDSLIASGQDSVMDSVLSFSTLIAAFISIFFHISLEGYLGVIIALFIIKASIDIIKDTVDSMLGTRTDPELVKKIKEEVSAYEEVHGVYDIVLHNYGPNQSIATVHVEVDDDMTAREIHGLTKQVQGELYQKLGIVTTLGIYASNNEDEESAAIRGELEKIISEYPEIIEMHGFYLEKEKKFVSFDLIFDLDCKDTVTIREEIKNRMAAKYPEYAYFIILDTDYTTSELIDN